jgi:hypothetical protein
MTEKHERGAAINPAPLITLSGHTHGPCTKKRGIHDALLSYQLCMHGTLLDFSMPCMRFTFNASETSIETLATYMCGWTMVYRISKQ